MEDKLKVVPFAIAIFVVFVVACWYMAGEFSITRKANKLKVGDTFCVYAITKNPFEEMYLFGGTILDKKGNYILYVNENGDTTTTNIRDAYANKETICVKVNDK